jgi:transposase InsO family protein
MSRFRTRLEGLDFNLHPKKPMAFCSTATETLYGSADVSEARTSIGRYLDFYNGRRPHSSLDGTTPDQAYFTPLPLRLAA